MKCSYEALVHRLIEKRAEEKRAKEILQTISKGVADIEAEILQRLEAEDLLSVKTTAGNISVSRRFNVRLPDSPEKYEEFWEWAKRNGHYEHLRSLNSQRLNSWYKAELEAARIRGDLEFQVPGLGGESVQTYLSLTKN